MRSANAMSRRKFLLLSGGIGGFVLGTSGLTWLASIWQDQEQTLHSRLITLFDHQQSARVIGKTYLQRYPQEADIRVLLKNVVPDRLGRPGNREFMEVLQRRIRQDFIEEKVVKLQGWILSTTEARLCALTALV